MAGETLCDLPSTSIEGVGSVPDFRSRLSLAKLAKISGRTNRSFNGSSF